MLSVPATQQWHCSVKNSSPHPLMGMKELFWYISCARHKNIGSWHCGAASLICHLQRQYAVLECRFESCCLLQLPAIIPGKAVEDCPTAWAPALPCPRPGCCSLGSEPKSGSALFPHLCSAFQMNEYQHIHICTRTWLGFILRACHCLLIPVLSQL